ncbi:serine/threonine-protein kinase [Haliangium sp.]|uniref:serine/threonine-protein kinase n=1 Tax=Haliangium sp. TaxID=2663208 RepID=UPI003D145701
MTRHDGHDRARVEPGADASETRPTATLVGSAWAEALRPPGWEPADTKVGRYVLGRPIGSGGMGVVYRAYDPVLDRELALKLIKPGCSVQAPIQCRRLVREARALARVAHPNVVTVFDAGHHRGCVFVAMELVRGDSLKAFVARSPRPHPGAILAVYLEAARGLAAIHDAGLTHRDFKPSNAIMGRDGRVRVIDFGLVTAHDEVEIEIDVEVAPARAGTAPGEPWTVGLDDESSTYDGRWVGTPGYVSPEQLRSAEVDPRSDQYSFCVSLHQALYGVHPFPARTESELFGPAAPRVRAPAASESAIRLDTHPAGALHRVIARGLAFDPDDRWPSMQALVDALSEAAVRSLGWPGSRWGTRAG